MDMTATEVGQAMAISGAYTRKTQLIAAKRFSDHYLGGRYVKEVIRNCHTQRSYIVFREGYGSNIEITPRMLRDGIMKKDTEVSIKEENKVKILLGIVPVIYGDGRHDDTASFQAMMDGEKVYFEDGSEIDNAIGNEVLVDYGMTHANNHLKNIELRRNVRAAELATQVTMTVPKDHYLIASNVDA